MKPLRYVIILGIGVGVLGITLAVARYYVPIAWFVGGEFGVTFTKGLDVGYNAVPRVKTLKLESVEDGFVCFSHPDGGFVPVEPSSSEEVRRLAGSDGKFVYGKEDGTICVR